MQSFENTLTIDRPAEDVCAFLADFEKMPRWNHAVENTTKTSAGPVGVGTTYRQTRLSPRRGEESFEVTVFDPPHRLGFEGVIGGIPARIDYALEPIGEATRLINAVELEPSSAVSRLLVRLAASKLKSAFASNLDNLKRILEGVPFAAVGQLTRAASRAERERRRFAPCRAGGADQGEQP